MVQLSENGGVDVAVPYPSTPPHGRPMMQPPQLTGDNRDSVTQHRSAFPPPHEGLRGEGSLGNGEARNGHSSTSGNGHGIGPAGGHLGTAGEENLQRPIPSQRPYVPHTDRMRKDRGPYPNSRREPPQPSRDRWTYYGDPRIRPDQSFLRDPRDLRGDPRDYRERRDPRDSRRDDRRDPRDDRRDLRDDRRDPRRDPRDERRDPRGDPREERRDPRGDPREERRDPKGDPREERRDPRDSRRDPRDSRRDPQDERRYPREERRYYRDERLEGRSDRPVDVRGDSRSYREERSDPKERKEPREERDNEGEGAPAEDGLEVVDGRCPEGDSGMGLKIEAEARGEGKCQEDREGGRARPESEGVREREYERERDRRRYRETGRDPEREPLRREPVGEETGYESDHSRMSRTTGMTAYSTSSRSFHWRPRADSVASQASVFSHASTRPPPVPGRTPRGYDDPYASRDLYEQYQYYYQYYRDNPYYKEYFRQWMKQYGQAYASESFLDERNSIHSGRSSINDELKKSISSQFIQDFHGRSTGVYEPSTIYSEGSFSQLKSYASGELSGVPSVTDETASEAPQRMTPVQFGRPHISASFTHGGQLLMVLPKDPRDGEKAVVQLRDVQKLLSLDPVIKEAIQQMKNYPGPLTLADTHKEVVVKYCEQQVADANNNPSLTDRESVVLIWEYLALLVKQNGKLLGSDIASLLLKGREVNSSTQHITPNTTPDEAPNTPASDSSPQDEGIDMHPQSTPSVVARDESLLLKKFTEYLCLGRKREAVDYAMREGLWGHALALSYKMDNNTHTRVLAAFSSSIPRTDVLLTLFQQLSGKRPEITKSYNAQQWGDWRQHLAMMVSNPSGHTQRDRASIITLGDTLASKGQLHAAHFCYLAAEAEWGTFSSKSSKLVLIGSSHHQSFQAFATNEAIQCSEVFEFARSLDSSNPTLETFLSYKLVYAMRLAEYGFSADSLRYCEVISQHVSKTSLTYPADFLSQVYDLASRLKYHDLHYQMCEGELLEMPDPEWLSNLQQLVEAARHREQMTNAEINQDSVDPSFSQSIPHGDYYQQTHSERSQQMNSERNTYHQENSADSYHQGAYQGQVPTTDTLDGQNSHSADHPSISQPEGLDMPSPQSEVPQPAEGASQSQETAAPQIPMMQPQPDQSYGAYDTSYWSGYQQTDPNMMPFTPSEPGKEMSSLPPSSDVNGEHLSAGVTSFSQPNSLSGYPGYQQPTYQQWDQQAHGTPTRSPEPNEPQPSPSPQVPHEEEPQWSDMSGKKSASSTTDATSEQKSESKTSSKDGDKDKSQEKNSSWSISSIFGWKKSKQAILPDDKNPTIVWDEAKKRWVNQDGEEEVAAPPPPPPKSPMSSAGGGGNSAPPPMKMRGMKKSRYVNTEKDKSQPNPTAVNPMIPPMPPSGSMNPTGPVMTPQFMVPDPSSAPEATSMQPQDEPQQQPQQQQQQQQQPAPPLPPEVTQGMLSDGDENAGAVPMMSAPSMQPQFFNPAQFTPAPSHPARRPGPGRRAYPVKR